MVACGDIGYGASSELLDSITMGLSLAQGEPGPYRSPLGTESIQLPLTRFNGSAIR
jgi:hypothetical protein